jgi:5,10-methylene-tetrahydrofolate dehydrogenase/methenyl tetrahydrofolate cyclohydrolase
MATNTWTSKEYIGRRIAQLRGTIQSSLIIVQFTDSPVIDSFVGRKLAMARELEVVCSLEKHTQLNEDIAYDMLQSIIAAHPTSGIIVQLPLPNGWNAENFLSMLNTSNDVDVLSPSVYSAWRAGDYDRLPPVVYAVKTSLGEAGITPVDLISRRIVVCGSGKLVGQPVQDWLCMQNILYSVIDIDTSAADRHQLLHSADIIISGTGAPHSVTSDDIHEGVVLIDCGTSSDAGVLQGDIHPDCAAVAQFMTRTPGGIGPLTVLGVFENLL